MIDTTECAAKLMLFDVDGTMLSGSIEVHWDALLHGIEHATGVRLPFEMDGKVARVNDLVVNGMTDHQSVDACLMQLELQPDELETSRKAVFAASAERYVQLLDHGGFPGEVFPGVFELLDALKSDGIATAVLTGGLRQIARKRMKATGLDPYFPTGAFGDDGVDRASLFAPAIRNAQAHYGAVFGDSIAYIGDTLRDVDAARKAGVKAIAVATGHTSSQELEDAGADLVFETLEGDVLPAIQALLER